MKNRVSKYPNRVLITPEDGTAPFYATMTRADEPIQEGTPINKATLLTDETAALFGLEGEATVNDVLSEIYKLYPRPILKVTTIPGATARVVYNERPMKGFITNQDDVDIWTFTLETLGDYDLTVSFGDNVGSAVLTISEVSVHEYDALALPVNGAFSANSWPLIGEMCKRKLVPESWAVGDTKPLTLDTGDTYTVRIVHKGGVPYADTSRGKAPIVFEFVEVLPDTYSLVASPNAPYSWSWDEWDLRTDVMPYVLSIIPQEVRDYISPVRLEKSTPTEDSVFILSASNYCSELTLYDDRVTFQYYAEQGTGRSDLRIKNIVGTTTPAEKYFTRTLYLNGSYKRFFFINELGTRVEDTNAANSGPINYYIAPAFCF